MIKIGSTLLLLFLTMLNNLFAQKAISDATILYQINIQNLQGKAVANNLTGSTFTVFLKGGSSRTDMVSSLGNEKTIHDGKNGTAVILKEYSGQKLMITMTSADWDNRLKKSSNISFSNLNETKEINGYSCEKATAKLNNGSTVTVYYTKELVPVNKEYSATFKSLPGLPIQYEFETSSMRFTYMLSKIDFGSVLSSKFDVPKSGYRVMNYEEGKNEKSD